MLGLPLKELSRWVSSLWRDLPTHKWTALSRTAETYLGDSGVELLSTIGLPLTQCEDFSNCEGHAVVFQGRPCSLVSLTPPRTGFPPGIDDGAVLAECGSSELILGSNGSLWWWSEEEGSTFLNPTIRELLLFMILVEDVHSDQSRLRSSGWPLRPDFEMRADYWRSQSSLVQNGAYADDIWSGLSDLHGGAIPADGWWHNYTEQVRFDQ